MRGIVTTEDVLGGKARIAGRRISVVQVGEMDTRASCSPEEIADQLEYSLAEVHAALAYSYDNPDEMAAIADRRAAVTADFVARSKAPGDHSGYRIAQPVRQGLPSSETTTDRRSAPLPLGGHRAVTPS